MGGRFCIMDVVVEEEVLRTAVHKWLVRSKTIEIEDCV